MSKQMVFFTVVTALILGLLFYGCGKPEKGEQAQTEEQAMEETHAEHPQMGLTAAALFTADTLFTCGMHPEVVTDKRDAQCPTCNMNLTAMTAEQLEKLRASHPKGCQKCNIVVPGDSQLTTCPSCGGALVEFERGEHQHG